MTFRVRCSRYNGGKIYTYIGEVCVSVNPYRTHNIYGKEFVSQYKGEQTGVKRCMGRGGEGREG